MTPAVRHGVVDANGMRLHHLDYGGDGRVVVLLHGVTGDAWQWAGVAPALAAAAHVVALDLRGHGESQWSADHAYATEDHVRDVLAVLRALDVDEVDLAGLSWGGLVALRVASGAAGPKVRRLGILDVPPSFTQGETEVPERPYAFDTHADVVAWMQQANPHAPAELVEVLAARGTKPGEGGRLIRTHDPHFSARWPFRSDDHWARLHEMRCPALVVHAADSYVLAADVAKRMAEELPDGRVETIPDSGHLVPVEQPEHTAAVLSNFFGG